MKLIPLTQGKFAKVDNEDYERLMRNKWCARKTRTGRFYATRSRYKQEPEMHRFIMNAPPNTEIDHRNNDGLDNQKHNLRVTTRSGNARNLPKVRYFRGHAPSSQYKGVCRAGKRWVAQISTRKNSVQNYFYLGTFESEVVAAKAYDAKAKEIFGEFAYLNFPQEPANANQAK